MRHTLIALTAVAALGFTSLPAAAQQAEAGAASRSASDSLSTSLAAAEGGDSRSSVVINTPPATTQTIRQSGTTTNRVESAPSLGGLALGGGHPCAYAPATGQISIIGGGLGIGGMQIDSACLLLIQAAAHGDRQAYNAAMYMIADRDNAACRAMYQAGMIADCVDSRGRSTIRRAVQAAPATSARPQARQAAYVKCERREDGRVQATVRRGADDATKQLAGVQCAAALQ